MLQRQLSIHHPWLYRLYNEAGLICISFDNVIHHYTGIILKSISPHSPKNRGKLWLKWYYTMLSLSRFCGKHLDGFGLINMNGRVYDPMLSRFLSPDPFVQAPGIAMGYNRYAYCLNNPFLYTDPSGNRFDPFGWAKRIWTSMWDDLDDFAKWADDTDWFPSSGQLGTGMNSSQNPYAYSEINGYRMFDTRKVESVSFSFNVPNSNFDPVVDVDAKIQHDLLVSNQQPGVDIENSKLYLEFKAEAVQQVKNYTPYLRGFWYNYNLRKNMVFWDKKRRGLIDYYRPNVRTTRPIPIRNRDIWDELNLSKEVVYKTGEVTLIIGGGVLDWFFAPFTGPSVYTPEMNWYEGNSNLYQ
ncbi:MAG: RHS repeat-associated core domain-containing protein [Marinilabiliaceae bacterium]|nr:RHS repeat-associated core domain-containing protein [Marinilabiliaceae bacterium]